MGDIESWWDEEFVSQIWTKLNKKVSVKVIKPKQGLLMHKLAAAAASNEVPNSSIFNHSGYCFIEFDTNEDATEALSLNGTIIQNTNNKLFRLNWASAATLNTQVDQSPEYSLFVGDLSPGTTEAHLLAFFQNYFDTVKTVRVMTDPATGLSRCFGFVRFGNEDDRKRALLEVNGRWLGGRPIRVALATPKHQNNSGNNNNNNHNHHHHRYNNNSSNINNNGGYDLMMNGVGVSSNAGVGSNGGQQYIHHNRHYRNNNDNGINNNNNNINNNNGRLNHHQVQQNVAARQAQAAHQAAMTAAAVAAGMIDPNTLDPQAQAAAAQAAAAAAASGMFIAPPPGVGGVPPRMPGVGVGVGGPHAPGPPPGVAAIGYYPPSFSPPNRNNSSGSLNDMDNINSPANAHTDQEPLGIHPSQFAIGPMHHPLHHSSVPVGSVSGNPPGLLAGPPPPQPPPPQMLHSHRSMSQLVYSDPNNTTVFVGGLANGVSDDTLMSFFEPFGEIIHVKVPQGKGCGFVKFSKREEAEQAIAAMQGFSISGSRIRLSWVTTFQIITMEVIMAVKISIMVEVIIIKIMETLT
ncbi:unnamed protein product [[Candida] boidinii]|nr:unnamed protein product [[Candida] boidinii]